MTEPVSPDRLMLHLQGFEGPLDLLLDLARHQKLDLAAISILSLVDQFLAVVDGARRVRLELAADWLVMAAWLAWLKSRLLVPAGEEGAEGANRPPNSLPRGCAISPACANSPNGSASKASLDTTSSRAVPRRT